MGKRLYMYISNRGGSSVLFWKEICLKNNMEYSAMHAKTVCARMY